MSSPASSPGRLLVWFLVVALFVMHQDFWSWNDRTLVLGFMPVTLFYHSIFSVAAGLVWALANKLAWPEELEAWASEVDTGSASEGGQE